jgi:hypothetical protein
MKYKEAATLRVHADTRIIMEVEGPISCETYFTALRACARASKRGCDTSIEMIGRDGTVDRRNPWSDIQRDMERSAEVA